jgi:uncharacterized protein
MIEEPSFLADFLASRRAPAGSLSMLALDGYLTALHVGPGLIPPGEWMAGIWGDDPVFDDENEAQSILNALMLHYNAIGAELGKDRKQYRPYGWQEDHAERAPTESAAEWSLGFWKGIRLRPHDWRPMILDRKARILLAPILCFIETEDGESVLRGDPHALDDLMIDAADMIPEVIPMIRAYWRSTATQTKQPRSARPGRNDPCSCGSGKKYKRCCGAS